MRKRTKKKTTQSLLGVACCALVYSFVTTSQILRVVVVDEAPKAGQGSLQKVRRSEYLNILQQILYHVEQEPLLSSTTTATTTKIHNTRNGLDFVRYSQLYQKDPNKAAQNQKLLQEKQNKLNQLQDPHEKMRAAWHSFQDQPVPLQDNIITFENDGNQVRVGYRPSPRKAKRRYPRILYFLHIHKSAGSTVCRQAYLNRISANYNQNCNVQADQHCCGHNDTLQAQLDYAKETPYELVMSEQEMYRSMAMDAYDYIVALRISRRRYYSHWNHLRKVASRQRNHELEQLRKHSHDYALADATIAWIQETLKGNNGSYLKAAQEDPVHWNYTIRDSDGVVFPVGNFTKWLWGQPDNYNLRMICGTLCKHTPKFQLTQQLFRYTLKRLLKFAHVMFVEDLEASFDKFARAYNWQYNLAPTITIEAIGTYNNTAIRQQLMEPNTLTSTLQKDVYPLWDPYLSVLDDALYEFAQWKYEEMPITNLEKKIEHFAFSNQPLVDEYFRIGPSRGCDNECCGVCSKW